MNTERGHNTRVLYLAALLFLAVAPAFGYAYHTCTFGQLDWGRSSVAFYPAKISFPAGSPERGAFEAAVAAWNNQAPGTRFRFSLVYDDASTITLDDGKPSVGFIASSSYNFSTPAVTERRWNCFFASHYTDADILFNANQAWDFNPAPSTPPAPYEPSYNFAIVALHELGKAMGLDDYDGALATMNRGYPHGGTLGSSNVALPLPSDLAGDRFLYGTCCTERDLFASAYKATSPGNSDRIPAPVTAYRGYPLNFLHTIGNRGTVQESARVEYYLSSDRSITTADIFLGAATLSLSPGVTSTLQLGLTYFPMNIPPGLYYLGYIIDPAASVPEVDENNNSVALVGSTNVPNYSPPMACFSADPMSGAEPLQVSFDGSCSSDPDGSIVSYQWDFGDGFSSTGPSVIHGYMGGTYTVRLTVRDNSGWTSETTRTIFVSGSCGAFPDPPCQ